MTQIRALTTLAVTATVLLVAIAPSVSFAARGDGISSKQLSALIVAVRVETDARKQELAAHKIPELLNGAELSSVDAKTLQDLSSLLDTSNDAVRRWVALSLSMFEGRAKFAVPRLLAILPSVDCANPRGPNSAETIRFAIQSISGMSPPPTACLQPAYRPQSDWYGTVLRDCGIDILSPTIPGKRETAAANGRVLLRVERTKAGKVRILEILKSEPIKVFKTTVTQLVGDFRCPTLPTAARGTLSITYTIRPNAPMPHYSKVDAILDVEVLPERNP